MSSVYTDKLYPEIPSAPHDDDEGQTYRLKKIDEVEKFLRDDIERRDKLYKDCKRRANAMTISDTTAITAITVLEVASIATLTTGVGLPVSIILASSGLLLGIGSAVIHKTQKIFESKAKKHDKIKTLAEAKLDTISSLVSKAIVDAHISHIEYQFILNEATHYREMKQQIRTKSKRVVDAITAEQRETILAEGREQAKQDFLRKIDLTSATQPVNAT
jgi:hypothetical protein